MGNSLKLAICQMMVSNHKDMNLDKAEEMIVNASSQGANIIVLPEIFNSPYQSDLFADYSEAYPGKTTVHLSRLAKENRVTLVGGSIPEKGKHGQIYNSTYSFDENGSLLSVYRKMHLFDIDIPGQITFKESDTLSAGENIQLINHNGICFAVLICYDCRFPEICRIAALKGAQLLLIPAAFNLTTGPAHWELLMRSRAVDNQLFVAAASPARNLEASYHAWGHSMIVDPWGTVIKEAGIGEEIIYAELDLTMIDKIRQQLPLLKQRRTDVYKLTYPGN